MLQVSMGRECGVMPVLSMLHSRANLTYCMALFRAGLRRAWDWAWAEALSEEGRRVITDHTYHVVSNFAAQGEDGKFVALKDYALGFKVRATCIMCCIVCCNAALGLCSV